MSETIEIQSVARSALDQSRLCSFNHEVIDAPTAPLIHQEARFLFINRGSGTIQIQNRPYPVRPNTLIGILPWQISQITEVKEAWQYYLVIYHLESVNRVLRIFYEESGGTVPWMTHLEQSPVLPCTVDQAAKLSRIFALLRDEIGLETSRQPAPSQPLRNTAVINYLVDIICAAERMLQPGQANRRRTAFDPSDILRYMYTHCGEKLTLKMLSQLFYYSESSISNYLTRVTGLSFFDLLNEMRVGKTASFLLYTDFTIEELAEILGYVDASHISKVFAARNGSKIGEYRRTYQKIEEICRIEENQTACRVISYIYRNYNQELSVGQTARKFGLSVAKLNHLLLEQIERNFDGFLNFVRINRASELLLRTGKTVDDIAMEVGYNSTKTFNRHFLKQRHMQPSVFRRSITLQEPPESGGSKAN